MDTSNSSAYLSRFVATTMKTVGAIHFHIMKQQLFSICVRYNFRHGPIALHSSYFVT